MRRTWVQARQWCKDNSTEMVQSRIQEESVFLNDFLPPYPTHYWLGIHRLSTEFIFEETNETVPEDALNWASGEPDSKLFQDCVEIYIKRETDTAKWNNENCRRRKATVCYTASCKQDSCSDNADCVETIGNYTCQCHPGFLGSRCEEAIACEPLLDPEQGSHYCLQSYGSDRFNSSCRFHCALGFHIAGEPQLLCQASGRWSHPVPLCQVEQCPVLDRSNISAGRINCSHPIALYSYNSSCEVRCDEGFEPSAPDQILCDHIGQWTASVPTCGAKRCPTLNSSSHGSFVCSDPHEEFSFGSRCTSSCEEGFVLNGTVDTECTSLGNWSADIPSCFAKRCPTLNSSSHGSFVCSDPHEEFSFGSRCTSSCEEGFVLNGTADTECTSLGNWSADIPTCFAKRCPTLNSSSHGSFVCSDPHEEFSFGTRCTSSCEEGFVLNGTADTECTSLGNWSADIPTCFAKRCPTLNSSSHGSFVCSDPHEEFSFGSRCTSTCEEGFVLNGTADTECTSLGNWSADIPTCFAKRCPTLNSSSHGSFVCSDPHEEFSFGSRCTSSCEEGFVLNGTADTECTSLGNWSTDIPTCFAKRCPTLNSSSHGSFVCSDPHEEFSFGSRCTSSCEEGFVLNGTADTECTSLGNWSADIPTCFAKRCPTLNSSFHGSFVCSDPHEEFSFGTRCTSSCEEGFVLNGTADTECTSLGNWSADIPTCFAKRCPTLNSSSHGSFVCSDPHEEFSFGSRCTSTCEEGFVLNGTVDTECTSLGNWSADVPTCFAKRCPTLNSSSHGSFVCSDPHEEFSFGSRCTSSCEEGFVLNGTADTECASVGNWSADVPTCFAKRCTTLNSSSHGSFVCSDPHEEFSFGSRCTSSCEEGFVLNGTADTECTSLGNWSADVPTCFAKRCPTLNSSSHGSFVCSDPHEEFSFGSRCTSSCEEGFVLNGTADTECTSLGTWTADIPTCFAKRCPTLNSSSHGSFVCSDPHEEFSFGSRCTSSCEEGFVLNGTVDTECTSLGMWSRELPHCLARPCPLVANASPHGRVNCSHPFSRFSYGSHCDFKCNEGFFLRGTPTLTCNNSGRWSQDLPTCQPLQCEDIRASLSLSVNCSHPLGNFSFGSQCLFTCEEGFSLYGTEVLFCSSTGSWNDSLPICTENMGTGTAMMQSSGVKAAYIVGPLVLIGLALLLIILFKKRGNPNMSEAPAWGVRDNPAFDFES
ncbi:P-selectin isoform X2 [Cottoperca gobio]|nr:P-selectin-like isoform X2 [Cottoperca gobio]